MKQILSFLEELTKVEKPLFKAETLAELKYMCRNVSYYNQDIPRILVIGRFKAGKSMLINALAGEKIAAVDALEKTAWIARYWPNEEEFCYYHKKDGSMQEVSVSEFIENTEEDKYPLTFLSEIGRIDVGYQKKEDYFALIDTPGFGSVNEENEKLALDSLKDADIVIYAVDVNKLGNLREEAIVSQIRESGIPMICVGTKYDGDIAHKKNREEVKKMVAKYTPFAEEEIYPVSAKNHMNPTMGKDEGLEELLTFCRQLSVENHVYRRKAEQSKRYSTNCRLTMCLQYLQTELERVQWTRKCFEQEYDYTRSRIRSEMAAFIRKYVSETLYAEYKEELVQTIHRINEQNLGEKGLEMLQNLIPEGYMENYWETLKEQILRKMHELWVEKYKVPSAELMELRGLFQKSEVLRNMDVTQMESLLQLGYSKELSEKGLKLSLGVAGLTSVYEAVFGINAAQVALFGAVFSTGLPIFLIGCGLTTFWLKRRNKSEKNETIDVQKVLERNIAQFAEGVIDSCLNKVEQLDMHLKGICIAAYDKELQASFPKMHSMDYLKEKCQNYLFELTKEQEFLWFFDTELEKVYQEMQNNVCEPKDIYRERCKRINHDLDEIIHDGHNKYALNGGLSSRLGQFENLIFLEEEPYAHFLEDLRELLCVGKSFASKHKKEICSLVEERYIYTRRKEYRIYYGVKDDTKEIEIHYIEAYIKDTKRNRELRYDLANVYPLTDDQIRYKMFDAILSAKKEILVEIPWIMRAAWEKRNSYPMSMKEVFETILQKEPNVKLVIVTGYSVSDKDSTAKKNDTDEMVKYLTDEFSKYKNRVVIYNPCEIHEKCLAVDDTCLMYGSLNYLSNQGIYSDEKINGGSRGRAGEGMAVNECPDNVERMRKVVYERAGQVYQRLASE